MSILADCGPWLKTLDIIQLRAGKKTAELAEDSWDYNGFMIYKCFFYCVFNGNFYHLLYDI